MKQYEQRFIAEYYETRTIFSKCSQMEMLTYFVVFENLNTNWNYQ